MKDLDWSDVEADADRMRDAQYNEQWLTFERMDDDELERLRYHMSITARSTDFSWTIDCLRMIDLLLLFRHTTLCEGCLDRTGCDMCNPFDPYDFASAFMTSDDADAHFERFGRPAFPNEY